MSSIRIPEESKKALVVLTPEPSSLSNLDHLAKQKNVKTKTASSKNEAIELMQSEMGLITCLVIDWDLEESERVAFLLEVRSTPKWHPIPIIMVSSALDENKAEAAMAAGIFQYIDKQQLNKRFEDALQKAIKDYNYYLYHVEKVKSSRLCHLAQSGVFKFKSLKEGYEIADWLATMCSGKRDDIVVGFIELLVNAVEHGNLKIGYQEKSDMLKEGDYVQALLARLELPEFKDRWVTVQFEKSQDKTVFIIQDEGDGFDWHKYLEFDKKRLLDAHGRGIAMSNKLYFDHLQYHGNGNKVEVHLNH